MFVFSIFSVSHAFPGTAFKACHSTDCACHAKASYSCSFKQVMGSVT